MLLWCWRSVSAAACPAVAAKPLAAPVAAVVVIGCCIRQTLVVAWPPLLLLLLLTTLVATAPLCEVDCESGSVAGTCEQVCTRTLTDMHGTACIAQPYSSTAWHTCTPAHACIHAPANHPRHTGKAHHTNKQPRHIHPCSPWGLLPLQPCPCGPACRLQWLLSAAAAAPLAGSVSSGCLAGRRESRPPSRAGCQPRCLLPPGARHRRPVPRHTGC